MFSKEILDRLLERTKDGTLEWKHRNTKPEVTAREAQKGSLLFLVASKYLGQSTGNKHYRFILEVWKSHKLILAESNSYLAGGYIAPGVDTVDVDAMQGLISVIEQQIQKRREHIATIQREIATQHILQEL